MRFLNKVLAKENESLYSFLFRTAISNYYIHLGSALKEIGPMIYSFSCNYMDERKIWYKSINKMIKMTERNCEDLILNQYNELLIQDKQLGKQQERFLYHQSFSKFCPECLTEDLYHRLYWDISLVTICTKHKRYLQESCISCQKKTRISRIMQNKCQCGEPFTRIRNLQIPTDNEIFSQKFIQELILGKIEESKTPFKKDYFRLFIYFCHLIDNLEVESLFPINKQIESFNFGMKTGNTNNKDVASFSIMATYVHHLIREPELYLPSLIDKLNNQTLSKGIRKSKFKLLHKIIKTELGKEHKNVYTKYFKSSPEYYVNRKKLIQIDIEEKEYLTFEEVIDLYKIPLRRLDFLCLQKKIKKVNINGVRLVDKESVIQYVKLMNKAFNKKEAAAKLGLSQERVIDLAKIGKLKALHGPTIDNCHFWAFHNTDIENFLNDILINCKIVRTVDDSIITFKEANFRLRYLDVSTIRLIELISEGVIESVVLDTEPNIKGIHVNKQSLQNFIEEENQKRIKKLGYTLKETAEQLNLDIRKLKKLISDGDINPSFTKNNPNGRISYYFDRNSVNQTKSLLQIN